MALSLHEGNMRFYLRKNFLTSGSRRQFMNPKTRSSWVLEKRSYFYDKISSKCGSSLAEAVTDSNPEDEESKKKAEEYSSTMQQAMGDSALIYRHELGINYAYLLPELIVGSCLQTPEDAHRLQREAGVKTVLCLQQDSDLAYFGLELSPIIQEISSMASMQHLRQEIRDFDAVSLRMNLPQAVAKLHAAMRKGQSPAYVHCTAGLGRAPAVALAYLYWLRGYELDEANQMLQKVRRCSPKMAAIRAATCDLITGFSTEPVKICYTHRGTAKSVQVAGLDIGWHNKLPLTLNLAERKWTLERNLAVGTYLYKFIVDEDKWTYCVDCCLTKPDDSGNINNYIDVIDGKVNSDSWSTRKRLMDPASVLTAEDRESIVKRLDELADEIERDF